MFFIFILFMLSCEAFSKPLIEEKAKGVVWNWGQMTLHLWKSGLCEFSEGQDPSYSLVVEGLTDLKESLSEEFDQAIGERIFRTSSLKESIFYLDQKVKILLENSLPRIFDRLDVQSKKSSSGEKAAFSGLILRNSLKQIKPRASYRICDETGKELYGLKDVDKESYKLHLMGRWFVQPSREEISRYVGYQPLSVEFEENEQGDFVVQGYAWEQFASKNSDILRESKIVFVLN